MNALLAALGLAGAVLMTGPGTPRRTTRGTSPERRVGQDRALLLRWRGPLSAGAVVGAWVVVGGPVGALAGLAAGIASWRVLGKVVSPDEVRRLRELERDLPMAVHLFGAALAAGSSVSRALTDVATAMPGAVGEEFDLLGRRLELGVDPASVWRSLTGPLRPVGRAMARAHDSGGAVVGAVDRLAEELRATSRARRDRLARSVEVRAAAPLGICFLPSFLLVGVIPMVVGLFTSLRLFD